MSTQVADISEKTIAPPSECIICTENLWKTYVMGQEQVHALRGVNLRIDRGACPHPDVIARRDATKQSP